MQKNEDLCLEPWIRYHGDMVGYENLYILDHHSDSQHVKDILSFYIPFGLHVMWLPESSDYRKKGEYVSYAMKQVEAGYDFVFPLDCDEFLALRLNDGHPTCSKKHICRYLAELPQDAKAFAVVENFLNVLRHPRTFFALPYRKVFFRGGSCGNVDHGSHTLLSPAMDVFETKLVYVHFHHKSFEKQKQASLQKLKPFVDVESGSELKDFHGPGEHLLLHLFGTEEEYYRIMTPDSRCIEFNELYDKLLSLDIEPDFCEQ